MAEYAKRTGIWNITEYGIFRDTEYSERWNMQIFEYSGLLNIQEGGIYGIFEYSGTLNIRKVEYVNIRIFRDTEYSEGGIYEYSNIQEH